VDPREVARLLEFPLLRLNTVLDVRVCGIDGLLWFVPGEIDAEVLLAEGVTRGRIWTAQELYDWLRIPGVTKVETRYVIEAKLHV
jgi:hypothetical protein